MRLIVSFVIIALFAILYSTAIAGPVGFGVYGGPLYPVAQEDQGDGAAFGLKIRAKLAGPILIEPNLNFGSYGDAEIEGVGKRDGAKLDYYGVDLTFGSGLGEVGLKPYVILGGGLYNNKRDGDETTNKSGWSTGAGVALGLIERLTIDLQGKVHIISSENSTSRKAWTISAGLIYFVGQK